MNRTVDWADLVTLDLGLFDKPNGKKALVSQLEYAVRHVGKFILAIITSASIILNGIVCN